MTPERLALIRSHIDDYSIGPGELHLWLEEVLDDRDALAAEAEALRKTPPLDLDAIVLDVKIEGMKRAVEMAELRRDAMKIESDAMHKLLGEARAEVEALRKERDALRTRLARACELLRDAMWNLREADRAHLAEPISAFLAGEVP